MLIRDFYILDQALIGESFKHFIDYTMGVMLLTNEEYKGYLDSNSTYQEYIDNKIGIKN